MGASGHLHEHVQDRHLVVSVRRTEMRHEVWIVDVRQFRHRSATQRRRLGFVQLHDQRRMGTAWSVFVASLNHSILISLVVVVVVVVVAAVFPSVIFVLVLVFIRFLCCLCLQYLAISSTVFLRRLFY